jgi:small-conductance mechanosensitive channel
VGRAVTFTQWWMEALAGARSRVAAVGGDLLQAPEELRLLGAGLRDALMSGQGVRGFTYLIILLLIGIGIEWLYWTYAYASVRAIRATAPESPRHALRLGLRRLALAASGLLLFTIATIGASAAFAWPAGLQELVIGATFLLLVLRFAWVVVVIVLAPGRPPYRLVPAAEQRALWFAALAMVAVSLLALGRFVPDAIERIAGYRHAAGALRFAMVTAACLILVGTAFAFFGRAKKGYVFPKSFVLALLVLSAYVVWLMLPSAATVAAIAAVVIALQIGLRDMVFYFWQGEDQVLPAIVLSAARFFVVLAGLAACALVLDAPVLALAANENPALRLTLRLVGVATLALLTHMVWITVRSAIDQRLSRVPPAGAHAPRDASSRLLTLLPLLRVTAAVVLFVMLVVASLWALGIEITPVLAGAGVVGLALGFGAQALVRDVIAGIFYLAEDAFRVGEYIESGTSTKGTVERITLRSVALRHHNGPLHFVPYGALGTVRNTSRDWVIEKFNLPLPIDVDSEKIRKLIKKVGEELLTDAEVGKLLIEPLKGKLYKIDPGVKIFRC